jgi:hypothetical protein
LPQVIPGFDLVFDDQYFHERSPVLRFAPFCAGNMGNPARLQKCNLAVSMALGEVAQNSLHRRTGANAVETQAQNRQDVASRRTSSVSRRGRHEEPSSPAQLRLMMRFASPGCLPVFPLRRLKRRNPDWRSAVEQAWRLNPQAAGLDAREAEARAAQDVAAGLTPEPGSVSIGNLNDRFNRNQWQAGIRGRTGGAAVAARPENGA